MRTLLLSAALLTPAAAHAFCGTYVGQPGAELYSGASQVVMARQGDQTVLTLVNDVEGSVKDFAVVIPVPQVLGEDDVQVVDTAFIERVQEYAGPRLVEYACSDFFYGGDWEGGPRTSCLGCNQNTMALDAGAASPPAPEALDVTVEAEFAAGEYDIVILSSEDSADLLTWLDREGYGVSGEAEALFGEYIAADSLFLAAKVRLEDVPISDDVVGRPYLSPLQLSYESESFSLPIRLGTVNSPGTQDLVLYTLTSSAEGSVAIANYDEAVLPSDCMYDDVRHGTLEQFLDTEMDAVVDANDGAAWVTTYSWWTGKCDPCPDGGPLEGPVLTALGFEGGVDEVHLTRLWMRYDADAAAEDVVLYTTGDDAWTQLRYIVYKQELEQQFEVCVDGWIDNPGTCEDQSARGRAQTSSLGGWPLLGFLGLLGGVGLALRRREQ